MSKQETVVTRSRNSYDVCSLLLVWKRVRCRHTASFLLFLKERARLSRAARVEDQNGVQKGTCSLGIEPGSSPAQW